VAATGLAGARRLAEAVSTEAAQGAAGEAARLPEEVPTVWEVVALVGGLPQVAARRDAALQPRAAGRREAEARTVAEAREAVRRRGAERRACRALFPEADRPGVPREGASGPGVAEERVPAVAGAALALQQETLVSSQEGVSRAARRQPSAADWRGSA